MSKQRSKKEITRQFFKNTEHPSHGGVDYWQGKVLEEGLAVIIEVLCDIRDSINQKETKK